MTYFGLVFSRKRGDFLFAFQNSNIRVAIAGKNEDMEKKKLQKETSALVITMFPADKNDAKN